MASHDARPDGGGPLPASIVAIDGPAASGKSTLACRLAEELGFLYFDTGVMYRAVTLKALESGIRVDDEEAVSEMASRMAIDVQSAPADGLPYRVLVDGKDVTAQLRQPDVDANVSQVSAYRRVRQAMTKRQREIGARGNVVMVGRDIGTVVLPEADLKIYLDATVEARARRRQLEILARGGDARYQAILESMKARDDFDSSRDLAPLKAADDAIVIDTTHLTVSQTVGRALELARQGSLLS
jgi:cytidylate kinase